MVVYKGILFFLCFIFCSSAFSQNQRKIDSLLFRLQHSTSDSQKVIIYNELVWLYSSKNMSKSEFYNNKAIQLAEKNKYFIELSLAYSQQGNILLYTGKTDQALKSFDKALKLYSDLHDEKGQAAVLGNISNLYFITGEYEKSLKLRINSLALNELLKNEDGLTKDYYSMANIYFMQKKYLSSKRYYIKAQTIYQRHNNYVEESNCLLNIGQIFLEETKIDSAKIYFEKVLKLANSNNLDFYIAEGITGLGRICLEQKDFLKAHMYFEQGLILFEKTGSKYKYLETIGNQTETYLKEGAYIKAISSAKTFLNISTQLNKKNYMLGALETLTESYSRLNDYENAYNYHLQYTALKDSLLSETHVKNMNELQVKFETNEKEKENKLLVSQNKIQALEITQNKYLMLVLLSIVLIGALLFWIFTQQQKLKSQQQAVKLEQRLLRSQMNPHFIFNSLASIESFIYENEPKEAGLYLSQFARLMRLILENSAKEYISLEKEIETLSYYLSLQKLRMYDKFNYSIDIDPSIEIQEIDIPPMLTQPFIENAIEHGFKGNKQEGIINIKFSLHEDILKIEISDNGIGIIQAQKQKGGQENHTSMAMKITEERLLFLNKSKKKKMVFSITDLSTENNEQQGTKICFSIPV